MKEEFFTEITHCRRIYNRAANTMTGRNRHLLSQDPEKFAVMMRDYYQGLMVKIFCSTAFADGKLSTKEEQLASILLKQLYNRSLNGSELKKTLRDLVPYGEALDWRTLVQPFLLYAPLHNEIIELETSLVRIMNMVVKADGVKTPDELRTMADIQNQLMDILGSHSEGPPTVEPNPPSQAAQQAQPDATGKNGTSSEPVTVIQMPEQSLEQALEDLRKLVGLESVKNEVNQLTNFIKVQQLRTEQGLAQNSLSLHMVLGGNPGTGKTTVARIFGRILGAMGVLKQGHLVETDRSGLVAEYAGQTGPKTNKVIDTAIDGVLFIDEAYSLIAEGGDDPFGNEAVQALLKRMEDDRERLVVILAGYPDEMGQLLQSNPGLSSRFAHRVDFPDYSPEELATIWLRIAEDNQYRMNADATAKLLIGLTYLFERKDKHFGNGRLIRNAFEKAIRHLADRIINVSPITRELLTQLEADDIRFESIPEELFSKDLMAASRFSIRCPSCGQESRITKDYFCRRFQCKTCQHKFTAESGTPLNLPSSASKTP